METPANARLPIASKQLLGLSKAAFIIYKSFLLATRTPSRCGAMKKPISVAGQSFNGV